MVHGDVKPENIVVSDDLRSVKIIDFGSAGGEYSPTTECAHIRIYTYFSFVAKVSAFSPLVELHRVFFGNSRSLELSAIRKTEKNVL